MSDTLLIEEIARLREDLRRAVELLNAIDQFSRMPSDQLERSGLAAIQLEDEIAAFVDGWK